MPKATAVKNKLRDLTFFESAPSVDSDNGVLRGVKLLGMESKNGRRYKPEALREAVALYDGRKIFINHPKRNEVGEDRQFESWVGEIRNPQIKPDGLYGDAHLLKSSDYFQGIVEAAQRFPKSVGFSHVADGESTLRNGLEIVESIREVFSVDLVCEPATTSGFFESVQPVKRITLRQVVEGLPESNAFRSRLIEAMDDGIFDGTNPIDGAGKADSEGDCEDDDEATLLDLISNVFQKALETVAAIVGSQAMADAHKQTNQPAPQQQQPPQQQQQQPPAAPAAKPAADPTTVHESRIAALESKLRIAEAKNALVEAGVEPTDVRVSTLANVPADQRAALIESWPKREASLTESRDEIWPRFSPPANTNQSGEYADPDYESRFWESRK